MVRSAAIVIAVLCVSSAAVAAEQGKFNLTCTGTEADRPNGKGVPFSTVYQIDLDAMKWCTPTKCGTVKEVTPIRITFADESKPGLDKRSLELSYVSRTDGSLVDYMSGSFLFWDRKAKCERAEFTPFPVTKF